MREHYLDEQKVLNQVIDHFLIAKNLPGVKAGMLHVPAYHGEMLGQTCACAIGIFDTKKRLDGEVVDDGSCISSIEMIYEQDSDLVEEIFASVIKNRGCRTPDQALLTDQELDFLTDIQCAHDESVSTASGFTGRDDGEMMNQFLTDFRSELKTRLARVGRKYHLELPEAIH